MIPECCDMTVLSSEISISLDSPLVEIPVMDPSSLFDALEYGLGFPRGYLDDFISSRSNSMSLRADLWEAFKAMKWALIPDLQHLKYTIDLWRRNRHCAVDKRDQYVLPPGQELDSGLIQYPYRLFHAKDIHICGPTKMSIENGTTYVWSTIPPYLHMVFAKEFMMRYNNDVSLTYVDYTSSLSSFDFLTGLHIPRAFVTPLPHTDRPVPWCIEDEEELERSVQRKRLERMLRKATQAANQAEPRTGANA